VRLLILFCIFMSGGFVEVAKADDLLHYLEARSGAPHEMLAVRDKPSQAGELVGFLQEGEIVAIRVPGNYQLDREKMEVRNQGVWRQIHNPGGRTYFIYDHWQSYKFINIKNRKILLKPKSESYNPTLYKQPGYVKPSDCRLMKNLCVEWPAGVTRLSFQGAQFDFVKSPGKNQRRYQLFYKAGLDESGKATVVGWLPATSVTRVISAESLPQADEIDLGPRFGLNFMIDYQFVSLRNEGSSNLHDTQQNARVGLHAYAPFVLTLEARGNVTYSYPVQGPEEDRPGVDIFRFEEFLLYTAYRREDTKIKLAAGGNLSVMLGENPGYAYNSFAAVHFGMFLETPKLLIALHGGPAVNSEGIKLKNLEANLEFGVIFPDEQSDHDFGVFLRFYALNFTSTKRNLTTRTMSTLIGIEKAF
jgi:hypothetical protein